MIDTILAEKLLPKVFADHPDCHADSDVWLQEPALTFRRGERYLVKAGSGRGKSSLCAYILGLRNDYLGTLKLDSRDIADIQPKELIRLRRNSLAYLPQEIKLFPTLTAIENIRLKNRLTSHKTEAEIRQMMEALDIQQFADKPAGRLSVGQQQRVGIVRALCQPFDFIILDEPVSHLDADANRLAAELIDHETAARGAGVIVTSVGNDMELPSAKIINL